MRTERPAGRCSICKSKNNTLYVLHQKDHVVRTGSFTQWLVPRLHVHVYSLHFIHTWSRCLSFPQISKHIFLSSSLFLSLFLSLSLFYPSSQQKHPLYYHLQRRLPFWHVLDSIYSTPRLTHTHRVLDINQSISIQAAGVWFLFCCLQVRQTT